MFFTSFTATRTEWRRDLFFFSSFFFFFLSFLRPHHLPSALQLLCLSFLLSLLLILGLSLLLLFLQGIFVTIIVLPSLIHMKLLLLLPPPSLSSPLYPHHPFLFLLVLRLYYPHVFRDVSRTAEAGATGSYASGEERKTENCLEKLP